MNLLRKEKDYYDYLVGIYGKDTHLTYDRRNAYKLDIIQDYSIKEGISEHHFAICNRKYVIFCLNNEFYHTVEDLLELVKYDKHFFNKELIQLEFQRKTQYNYINLSDKEKAELLFNLLNCETNLNKKERDPVLKLLGDNGNIPVLLKNLGFPKWYSAKYMYVNIQNFLGWLNDNPEIPNNQTDKEKINSHGFDNKISFRHRKI